jgi:hypothetical protein
MRSLARGLWLALACCGRVGFDPRLDATAAIASCAQSNGLVGYWPFDENQGAVTTDVSQFHQDATFSGDTNWTVGAIGSALHFDGTLDYASFQAAALGFASGTSSFSLSYWLSPASLTNAANDVRAFEIAYCVGGSYIFARILPDGTAGAVVYDDIGHNANTDSLPGALQIGRWTHVAHVIDRGAALGQTYIDGMPSGAASSLSVLTGRIDCSVADKSSFGGWAYGTNFEYAGDLDDVRIYDRVLSASELQQLATLTSSGCPF